jgi:hypothetical protein
MLSRLGGLPAFSCLRSQGCLVLASRQDAKPWRRSGRSRWGAAPDQVGSTLGSQKGAPSTASSHLGLTVKVGS